MGEYRSRLFTKADGSSGIYFFGDRKTEGGASIRYAWISFEDDECWLVLNDRDSGIHETTLVTSTNAHSLPIRIDDFLSERDEAKRKAGA